MATQVLILDDERNYLLILQALLEGSGYAVTALDDPEMGMAYLEESEVDVVITDMKMPKMTGQEVLERVKKTYPHVPVIIMTAFGSIEAAVEAMRVGAYDYVTKPFSNDELMLTVGKAAQYAKAKRENLMLRQTLEERFSVHQVIGRSKAMGQVLELVERAAPSRSTVLIMGESGTGKEMVAKAIHFASPRKDGPFVSVNCMALSTGVLESELFGHEKGSFTGAVARKRGRFEMAHGGTLLLDEVGELTPELQVKLLRVLQERTFERVGSNKTQNVDVRIIAATHKNLEKMIEDGTFREDLYYRLNVFPIEMAPLRERVEDIALLLNELISRMEHEKRGSIRFNSAAIMSLCRHDWPGNVRELANLVERLAIMHPYGVIGVGELPKKFRHVDDEDEQLASSLREELEERAAINAGLPGMDAPAMLPAEGLDLKDYLANLEQGLIQQALDDAGGVVARAAERLRIRRTTLVEKMRKYGMSRRDDDLSDD